MLISLIIDTPRIITFNTFSLGQRHFALHISRVTGSIPGGLTATLALHKWRSKNAPFKTPLYL